MSFDELHGLSQLITEEVATVYDSLETEGE